jgi:TatD DNase family protein
MIDTHTHLDGEEFKDDLPEVIKRAKQAGVSKVFIPAIDLPSVSRILNVSQQYSGYAYPMIGLQPEEVRADYKDVTAKMKTMLYDNLSLETGSKFIAVGEVGLDFYWSREFEQEQLDAFEEEVKWSVDTRLPLVIHCRKAQNEMIKILRRYNDDLPGGIFHCFTGNAHEAEELLAFKNFMLGIGGVLTFKSSHLPEVLPAAVPLERIVLETDSPYMAPVPHRGERNESSFIIEVMKKLAASYGISEELVSRQTDANVQNVFGI